jgi:hypothetical protein
VENPFFLDHLKTGHSSPNTPKQNNNYLTPGLGGQFFSAKGGQDR